VLLLTVGRMSMSYQSVALPGRQLRGREIQMGQDNSPWVIEGNGVDDWLKKLGKKCPTM
jgi:hypothetical protein